MELLRDVSATENKVMRKVMAADGSTRLVMAQDVKIAANEVALPQELIIMLKAFSESEPVGIRARLSVKVKDGTISFRVALQGMDVVLHEAIQVIIDALMLRDPGKTFRGYVESALPRG
jgi:hypothetical protein